MLRSFLILLTIASLAVCPYRCTGASVPVRDAGSAAMQSHGCPCCSHECDSQGSHSQDAPAKSNGDCACNCVCKGAVKADVPGLPDLAAGVSWLADASESLQIAALEMGLQHSTDEPPPLLRGFAGRDLCYAVQSLLL